MGHRVRTSRWWITGYGWEDHGPLSRSLAWSLVPPSVRPRPPTCSSRRPRSLGGRRRSWICTCPIPSVRPRPFPFGSRKNGWPLKHGRIPLSYLCYGSMGQPTKVRRKQEGNVLRNLRPAMFQMLMCKILHIYLRPCPNVHDVQMSVMWSHLIHVVTPVTCSHTCHLWSHLSHLVTCVTLH